MSLVIIDNESRYTEALLKLLLDKNPKVINYKDLDYRNLQKGDVVVLTGGHGDPVLWHKKQYAKEAELIKKHKGPVIGICLGFELIAHLYGSHLHFMKERRKGEVKLISGKHSSLRIPASFTAYENHKWSVPHVKRPLVALAFSSDGVEIFKHRRKPIYGLQFHPEESGNEALEVFKDILGRYVARDPKSS